MTYGYMIYQAERPISPTEQRAVDAQQGELARSISRLLHPRRHAAAPCSGACTTFMVPDYPPAEWVAARR